MQPSVLPSHLGESKAWLLIPQSSDSEMTILVTPTYHPPELLKFRLSWNTVVGKLESLEAEQEDAILALDGH